MNSDNLLDSNIEERLVAGVDEAGRGPLAGSVVAAAVILDPTRPIEGLTDSKKLSEKKRIILEQEIKQKALCWSIAEASQLEIDEINILHASMLAMQRAVLALDIKPQQVLVDGNREPDLAEYDVQAIVKGDLTEPCISAASILAKQYRDKQMLEMDVVYPQYQFAKHKGYPTKLHRELLIEHGASPIHRRSFRPVKEVL
ncbi:MAG: ribonuclease HII [Gammaproteobacteria bacterium]|jgi:ribonuclease HII|nr:ribonuclease HII [Gammaproteobacteria bacterium]MBT3724112.1 ribonuclease HII [Gammaproteobacteria bacterium]MBT4076595.1 ribonuclease HII [Gammaproteobacteria bacterium]MBT4193919.1 ribonuclease HII [Gammaproteobacteria bacterium]MBT4451217.1 ribonuclease HII [Gammaproteobacteria bacterium]